MQLSLVTEHVAHFSGNSGRDICEMFAQLADKEGVDAKIQEELHPKDGVQVRIGLIGVGAVAAFHHIPGIRLDSRAALTAICDPDAGLLEKRSQVRIRVLL